MIRSTQNAWQLIRLIEEFVNSRPRFDPGNYSDASSYRADMRRAMRHRQDAHVMIRYCLRATGDIEPHIRDALRTGRLTLRDDGTLDYCTGQYYPTEYRAAACRVLSSALWHFWRTPTSTADSLRATARVALPRSVANRWFS
jgi:hypothetical protein